MKPHSSDRFTAASVDRRLIALPAGVTVIVGVASVAVSASVGGGAAALGSLIGIAVVLAFFGAGQAVVGRTLRSNPAIAVNMALLVYVVQIAVLFVVMIVLKRTDWFEPRAFAATIFAGVIAWIAASVVTILRSRVLVVEPGSGPPAQPPEDRG